MHAQILASQIEKNKNAIDKENASKMEGFRI